MKSLAVLVSACLTLMLMPACISVKYSEPDRVIVRPPANDHPTAEPPTVPAPTTQ